MLSETLPQTVPLDGPSARLYAEVAGMLTRFNTVLEDDSDQKVGQDESQAALRLALAAMTEAQKRIERQESRIRELESLSVTDELTELMNRRGFDLQLTKCLAQAKRSGRCGGVIMIDLDRFKPINDTFGHAAGDHVLQAVAAILTAEVRESDTVARLGGDEFAILMPDLDEDDCRIRVDALRQRLNSQQILWQDAVLQVSASVGAVTYHGGDDDDARTLLDDADRLMYAQKSLRRPQLEARPGA